MRPSCHSSPNQGARLRLPLQGGPPSHHEGKDEKSSVLCFYFAASACADFAPSLKEKDTTANCMVFKSVAWK